MNFIKKNITELNENFVNMISGDWMLITTATDTIPNVMTASWGGVGELWSKHVTFAFVRPSRYTYGLLEKNERYVLNFLEDGNREILNYCGKKSGRDTDKISDTALNFLEYEKGVYVFDKTKYAIVCKKLYSQNMNKESFISADAAEAAYPAGDIHKMYIGEIEYVLCRE